MQERPKGLKGRTCRLRKAALSARGARGGRRQITPRHPDLPWRARTFPLPHLVSDYTRSPRIFGVSSYAPFPSLPANDSGRPHGLCRFVSSNQVRRLFQNVTVQIQWPKVAAAVFALPVHNGVVTRRFADARCSLCDYAPRESIITFSSRSLFAT